MTESDEVPTCSSCGAPAIVHISGALVCTVQACGQGWEHVITTLPGQPPMLPPESNPQT